MTDHGHPVTAVSLSSLSGGQVLVLSGSWRQEVRIYSQHDKTNLASVRLPRYVTFVSNIILLQSGGTPRKIVRCLSVQGSTAAVGCQDPSQGQCPASDLASVLILDLTTSGASVRRELRPGASLTCVSLRGERLAAAGDGWLAAWRVLDRANYSRWLASLWFTASSHLQTGV